MASVYNILVSPVKILYSATGVSVPADTVAVDGAWPTGWTTVGYTKEPLKLDYSYDMLDFDIQESLAPIDRRKIKETAKFTTIIAEFTIPYLALNWEGTVSTTAAGAGQPAKEELIMGDLNIPTIRQWGFEGSYLNSAGVACPVRIFVWRATSTAGGEIEFGKADTTGVPLEISALSDMTLSKGARLFKIQRITAAATS